jgi:uncharacterized protein YgiM (DUF1202 family)
MKRSVFVFCIILFAAGIASAQAKKGGTMYVSVKTAALKASTGAFAGTTGTLEYGEKVTVIQIDGKNAEIKSTANPSKTGWIPMANLSAKQVVTGTSSTASAKEISLAGKGFNQEVENAYKSKGKVNYADVDKIETQSVKEADLKKFIEDGRLAMGE